MAKTVSTTEELELYDGTTVRVRPLPISKLKVAMAFIDEETSKETETNTDGLDFLVDLATICLKGAPLPEDYVLEDNLDTATAKRIIAVCTGIDFDDENLILAAMTAAVPNGETST